CEQMEDPRHAKGIVERAIVRVVTAGTITEEDALDARAPNFLASLAPGGEGGEKAGLAWLDVSTGRLGALGTTLREAPDEIARLAPAELLWSREAVAPHAMLADVARELGRRISERDPWCFERESCLRALRKHFKVASLEGF